MQRLLQSWVNRAQRKMSTVIQKAEISVRVLPSRLASLWGVLEISEAELCAQLTKLGVASSITVCIGEGEIVFSGYFDGVGERDCVVEIKKVSFAPRGAKELVFRSRSDKHLVHSVMEKLVASIALVVANKLWGMLINLEDISTLPPVSHETDSYHVDLRDIACLRTLDKEPWQSLLDVIQLKHIVVDSSKMVLALDSGVFG